MTEVQIFFPFPAIADLQKQMFSGCIFFFSIFFLSEICAQVFLYYFLPRSQWFLCQSVQRAYFQVSSFLTSPTFWPADHILLLKLLLTRLLEAFLSLCIFFLPLRPNFLLCRHILLYLTSFFPLTLYILYLYPWL